MTAHLFRDQDRLRTARRRHCPTASEQLLMACIRAWAGARSQRVRPHAAVAGALSRQASSRAAALFLAWVQAVEVAAVRPIEPDCPDCGGVSLDVQRLVVACGLASVDFAAALELIRPLVLDPEGVLTLGRALNAALAEAGWPLPARLPAPLTSEAPQRLH